MQRLLTAAALVLLFTHAVTAQEGFRSPSGNIHCQFFEGDGNAAIRCDLREISNRPPPRPRSCDLDWGHAFEIARSGAAGTRLCYGDTVQDNRLPVLPYGQSWQRAGFACTSEKSGVTCRNAGGHGFTLSRAVQSVF